MKKTKVYWCTMANRPQEFCDYGLLPLIKELKGNPYMDERTATILKCPCTIDHIKNMYVARSPYNINMRRTKEGVQIVWMEQPFAEFEGGTKLANTGHHIMLHDIYNYTFFSETSVNLTITPPYLHPYTSPGAAGTFDISKWYRPISSTHMLAREQDNAVIKQGEATCYISFDRPVELIKYRMTENLFEIGTEAANYKKYKRNTPLKLLYSMFERNKMKKTVMKEIKENLL